MLIRNSKEINVYLHDDDSVKMLTFFAYKKNNQVYLLPFLQGMSITLFSHYLDRIYIQNVWVFFFNCV